MSDDRQLLKEYVETGDHQVFRNLVERYLPLVHSVASRVLNGDVHEAEDVCQTVFSKLAARATSLPKEVVLAGWLHHDSYQTALGVIRRERRRKERELKAMQEGHANSDECDWEAVRPVLDEILNELPLVEREAILLRFFERLNLNEIASRLQLGESGASRRISKALESLRQLLARRGITTTGTALSAALTLNAVQAAPAGLSIKVMSAAPALMPAGSAILFMATKIKLLVGTAAIVAVGVGIGIWSIVVAPDTRSQASLRAEKVEAESGDTAGRRSLKPRLSAAAKEPVTDMALALERLREVLFSLGRDSRHPSQRLEDALLPFRDNRKIALPLLQEALRDSNWERRRRGLAGLTLLSPGPEEAEEAIGDVLRVLRECRQPQDAFLATSALETLIQSPITDANTVQVMVADLIQTIRENPAARMATANLASSLVEPGSSNSSTIAEQFEVLLSDSDPEVQSVAANILATIGKGGGDNRVLKQATSDLSSAEPDDRVRGMATLMNLGDGATNATPALRAFLARPQRHDIRFSAQNFLERLDPQFRQERAAFEEERTKSFMESLNRGEASIDDALVALTDLPKAATEAANALGSVNINDLRDDPDMVLGMVTTLRVIAGGSLPLETRLAASYAYGRLQPTMPRPIYSYSELEKMRNKVEASLANVSEYHRSAAQAAWNGTFEVEARFWTNIYKRTGGVTDIPSANLAGFAQQIRTLDQTVYSEFVNEMQKVDPNFAQYLRK